MCGILRPKFLVIKFSKFFQNVARPFMKSDAECVNVNKSDNVTEI
jgi:hypothetical protein